MNKVSVRIAAAIATVLLIFSVFFLWTGRTTAEAAGPYDFDIERFAVSMDISPDRTIAVKEEIVCLFTGYDSHGIIRDFPLDAGVRYYDIEAQCDNVDFSPYTQSDDGDFLSLYLRGQGRVTGQRRTYTLSYTMKVPALSDRDYLPIDVLGYGWDSKISEFSALLTIPEGLTDFQIFAGYSGSRDDGGALVERQGNQLIISAESLGGGKGLTVDLKFESGVLGTSFDMAILLVLLLGFLLVGLALLVKFFLCRQPMITTTVNLEAPENMDPLLMGKLIDGVVDNEDLGALVFYLADEGYLTIDLEDEENPLLSATGKVLPPNVSSHIKIFYDGLFLGRKSVRLKDLSSKFYSTAAGAKGSVELQSGKLYERRSIVLLGVFWVLTVLLLGGFAFVYHLVRVFSGYLYGAAAIASLIAFLCAAAGSYYAKMHEKKWSKFKIIGLSVGSFLLGLLSMIVFAFFSSPVFGLWTELIVVVSAALTGSISGGFLTRTKEYSAKLGQILGFKQFILFTERDKIEFMLQQNPELYYHILPFAQVLGVTDAWTDKFKGLALQPPTYASGYHYDLFDLVIWSHMMHSLTVNMAHTFVSRPSSSGRGVSGGGFGGGFGGGGFGGGGGRGC